MKDRSVQFPRRRRLVPVEGQENTFDVYEEPGVVYEAGTPLNKANLLSDETASLYGLSGDRANVDEVLKQILNKAKSNYNKEYTVVTFTTGQNWIVPANVNEVDVFLVGGGASGTASVSGYGTSDGGAGYVKFMPKVKVVPLSFVPVTIGAGGILINPAGVQNGYAGGNSSFGNIKCSGGFTGQYGSRNSTASSGRGNNNVEVPFSGICPFNGIEYANKANPNTVIDGNSNDGYYGAGVYIDGTKSSYGNKGIVIIAYRTFE